jgi:hypothetical protein
MVFEQATNHVSAHASKADHSDLHKYLERPCAGTGISFKFAFFPFAGAD